MTPSAAAALLRLARRKAELTQRDLAERAAVPTTMISAYERDKRQPTLGTLLKLVHAAGFELRMNLEPYDSSAEPRRASFDEGQPRERLAITPAQRLATFTASSRNLDSMRRRARRVNEGS